jgi:WD40 repeat protein
MRVLSSQFPLVKRKLNEIEREYEMVRAKSSRSDDEEKLLRDHDKRVAKYNHTLSWTQNKFIDLSSRNDALGKKLLALPFLRRVRAFKWNITISTSAFEAFTGFVSSRDDLLPMTALLQSRCHLLVERRDPLPFCPPAVLEDIVGEIKKEGKEDSVTWAAPIHPLARAIEAGEDLATHGVTGNEPPHRLSRSILTHSEALPFPKIRLEDGDNTKDGKARAAVEFNRALLINGFRRLEALELKQEYEAGMFSSTAGSGSKRQVHIADALQPSILLATICSSSSSTAQCSEADAGAGPASDATWREPNIGITSASICPPDGRKVALGCDDSAVRIWSLDRLTNRGKSSKPNNPSGASVLGEPSLVLLGHKNGFPVFDVDWTKNGRTLLSAGGDGTVRLWDTQAVGPYGELSNVTVHQKGDSSHTVGGPASTSLSTVIVPGSKAESLVKVGGAALSVYRGHAPSTPVWGVSSAPCGYYFASAGSDYTARIWATDRTSPIRVLSGHVSPSVNCVAWHPNCNYVVTASDDKTCRMFDIQTGRCVRLLSGSTRGLNLVRVSPSGRYAAGSGYDGVLRVWDLGNGRLINVLRPESASSSPSSYSEGLIHSMSFSSCGTALAVSGVDCTLRIWDVRGAGNRLSNPDYFAAMRGPTATSSFSNGLSGAASKPQLELMSGSQRSRPGTRVPAKVFKTNNVSILDLKYTKRNLLLAVGDC